MPRGCSWELSADGTGGGLAEGLVAAGTWIDLGPEWSWLPPMITLVLVLAATTVYVLRLNASHHRLRSSFEAQLAEREKVEEALRESEVFYHSLVESLPQSILRKDREGRFTFGNQKFCTGLGLPIHEILGKTDFDFFPHELAEKYRKDDAWVMKAGQIFETVEEHVTPQGERLYVQVIKTPLHDPSGAVIGIQGIFWDVTERKRAEEQLRAQYEQMERMAQSEREAHEALKQAQSRLVQSAKLAGLGQMVAGVAHEINNPLAFVGNNVAVLQRDLGDLHDLVNLYEQADDLIAQHRPALLEQIRRHREDMDIDYSLENLPRLLERTHEGLDRIRRIVKDLRIFARLDESELNQVDLNASIESTVTIVAGQAKKKGVKIDQDLQPLPSVTCFPARINQVVMNLLSNAIDACDQGGQVTVRTGTENGAVFIEVADTGCGIDPVIRDRIFDPFFTTKPVGEGTGLGLSISYGIVQDHGGRIEVDSRPGHGARFIVRLPLEPPLKREGLSAAASSS